MDVYNKHFLKKTKRTKETTDISHDHFYTDKEIVDAFSRYVATIVKRYANEPSVLGTPLLFICYSGCINFIFKAGNLPTTHAVPLPCPHRRIVHRRPLLNGLQPSQQS